MVLPKHARTRFQYYFTSMSANEKRAYAKRLGIHPTTVKTNYIYPTNKPYKYHFLYNRPTRGSPTQKLMFEMAEATQGHCSYSDMREHFYPVLREVGEAVESIAA